MPSKRNRRNLQPMRIQQRRNKRRSEVLPTYCPACNFEADDEVSFCLHVDDTRHKYNYLLYNYNHKKIHKAKNRHGVEVYVHCDGEELLPMKDGTVKVTVSPEQSKVLYHFEVKNVSVKYKEPIIVSQVCLLHPYKAFSFEDVNEAGYKKDSNTPLNPLQFLKQGQSYKITVKFTNCGIGTYGIPLCFTIQRRKQADSVSKDFDIIRMLVVKVVSGDRLDELSEEEKQKSPFTGERWEGMEITMPGTMPDGRRIKSLLEYSIPTNLCEIFKHHLAPWTGINMEETAELRKLLHLLCDSSSDSSLLQENNYEEILHKLLFLDEFDAMEKLGQYNMENVSVDIINDTRISLEVPGLAERRPSVLKGDLIYLRVSLGKNNVERVQWEGVVAEVGDTCIWIAGFHPALMERLQEDPSLKFDVHFTLNRFPYYIMHRSIDLLEDNHVVFPTEMSLPVLQTKGSINFINPLIKTNPEQQKAVTNIVIGTSRPAPYIIFGPPGTGKTVTVVEAILQVKKHFGNSYILVCAPANAACDYLAQKLAVHCTQKELLRLHSSSRDWSTVPVDLHPYSNRSEGSYCFPKLSDLYTYRIIVCSLINSGRLLPKEDCDKHFTHVFIDECGQALEPAALVPIAGILREATEYRPGGQVILAGDPKQLGPVCESKLAELKFGLGVSLLERLMSTQPLYMKNDNNMYDDRFITKLRRNFRSHSLILKLPNELFYDGELISECAQSVTDDQVKNLEENKYCKAVVFHGVIGHERREGRSPSYYNVYELNQVLIYVGKLLSSADNRPPVEQSDIGIITPYQRQVYKLKATLKQKGWGNVEVGTTETFQGREKRVILVSTVRSNRNLLDYDGRFRLGFVANPKRFNVAITRAQSLLIVVGNPHLLVGDENWKKLIMLTQKKGTYRGCVFQSRFEPKWMDEVVSRLGNLKDD